MAVGAVLMAARDLIPDLFSIVVANTLIAAGAAWQYLGNRAFQGKKNEFPWHWLTVAIVAVLFICFTYLTPNLSARMATVSAALCFIQIPSALVLLGPSSTEDHFIQRVVAVAYLLNSAFFGVHTAFSLFSGPMTQDFMIMTGFITTSVFVSQIGLTIVLCIGLPLMVLGRTHRKLIASEAHLQAIIEGEPECVEVIDRQGRLMQMNSAGLAMIQAESIERVRGKPVLDMVAPDYRTAYADLHARVIAGEKVQMELEMVDLKGRRLWVETHASPMEGDGESAHLAVTRDITERKKMETQVRQLAFHDTLTNLPNRRLLLDRLNQAMAAAKRSGCYGALIFLDLDNFKPLNDVHGHEAGDLLLIEVARRLTSSVRQIDTVSRFGGDEFVVLLGELTMDQAHATEHSDKLAEKVRSTLAQPYLLAAGNESQTIEHHCSASIGVVLFSKEHSDADNLLKWADAAMYRSKFEGRNRVTLMVERRAKQRSSQ